MPLPDLIAAVRSHYRPGDPAARRLCHGRGGCYPGLEAVTLDWFPPVAVLTLYAPLSPPVLAAWTEQLGAVLRPELAGLLAQHRHLPEAPWEVLWGQLPAPVHAREAGLRYRLRLGAGQNLGFFLDMLEGRALVRRRADGRRVLNLFAYTCAFSVAALAGGAAQVVNLDMNRGALEVGRQNHQDNGLDLRRAAFLPHDVFKSFGKLRRLGPFDLVVIDPPTHQGASFTARRDWPRLLRQLPSLLAPAAEVVACLNSPHLGPAFLREQFAAHAPGCNFVEQLPLPADFPDRTPDRGLKVMRFCWKG